MPEESDGLVQTLLGVQETGCRPIGEEDVCPLRSPSQTAHPQQPAGADMDKIQEQGSFFVEL